MNRNSNQLAVIIRVRVQEMWFTCWFWSDYFRTLVRIQIEVIVCFSHRFFGNCYLFFFFFQILLVIAINDQIMCVLNAYLWPAAQMAQNASEHVWTEIETKCYVLFFLTFRYFLYREINQNWDPFEQHSGRHADWLQFNHFKSTWVFNE